MDRNLLRGLGGCIGLWLVGLSGIVALCLPVWSEAKWTFALPEGGSISYRTQSSIMRFNLAPSGSSLSIVWRLRSGGQLVYPMGRGSHRTLQARIRKDHRAIWLVDPDRKAIAATLDLDTGDFTGEHGVIYDFDGTQGEVNPLPQWATLDGGTVLAQKTFY